MRDGGCFEKEIVAANDMPSAATCRVLTEKMQEQSLVSQGFAGF